MRTVEVIVGVVEDTTITLTVPEATITKALLAATNEQLLMLKTTDDTHFIIPMDKVVFISVSPPSVENTMDDQTGVETR